MKRPGPGPGSGSDRHAGTFSLELTGVCRGFCCGLSPPTATDRHRPPPTATGIYWSRSIPADLWRYSLMPVSEGVSEGVRDGQGGHKAGGGGCLPSGLLEGQRPVRRRERSSASPATL